MTVASICYDDVLELRLHSSLEPVLWRSRYVAEFFRIEYSSPVLADLSFLMSSYQCFQEEERVCRKF